MKVLVVYASLGAGHKRAAEALHDSLGKRGIQAECRDLLDFLPRPLPRFYAGGYTFMITRTRWLWRLLYQTADRLKAPYAPARSRMQCWQFTAFKNYLNQHQFDYIFSTHFASSALLIDWKQDLGFSGKAASIVTDYVAHRCWKRAGLDYYFVPCESVAEELVAGGIPRMKISVTGIPISSDFQTCCSRQEARCRYQCADDQFLTLALCSALSPRTATKLLREIRGVSPSMRILVSAGRNPRKELALKRIFAADSGITIFGFSNKINEMMRAADVVITKPGGLTVSEALVMGVPQILLPAVPGQEEGNARYAAQSGAAVCVPWRKGEIGRALESLLADPLRLKQMAGAAERIAHPGAAQAILDAMLLPN